MPLDEHTDVRSTMKLMQQLRKGIEPPEVLETFEAETPVIPVKDTEIVVEKLIGDESTGSKGLAAECNFKAGDVILSLNGIQVSGE